MIAAWSIRVSSVCSIVEQFSLSFIRVRSPTFRPIIRSVCRQFAECVRSQLVANIGEETSINAHFCDITSSRTGDHVITHVPCLYGYSARRHYYQPFVTVQNTRHNYSSLQTLWGSQAYTVKYTRLSHLEYFFFAVTQPLASAAQHVHKLFTQGQYVGADVRYRKAHRPRVLLQSVEDLILYVLSEFIRVNRWVCKQLNFCNAHETNWAYCSAFRLE